MKRLIKSALLALLIFCIFGVNSLAEENFEFDISASDSDEVIADLTEKDGKYELFISGSGRMTEFSSVNDLPWREYADKVDSVIIGEGVENVPFAIFRYASRLEVRNVSATIEVGYEYDIEYYGHAISTMATWVKDCFIESFYLICDFQNARCTECGYECKDHGGGTPTCTEDALCSVCSYPYEGCLGHAMINVLVPTAVFNSYPRMLVKIRSIIIPPPAPTNPQIKPITTPQKIDCMTLTQRAFSAFASFVVMTGLKMNLIPSTVVMSKENDPIVFCGIYVPA